MTTEEQTPDHPAVASRSLTDVGVDTRLRLGRITVLERRRRPSGEAVALPRDFDRTLGVWAVIAAVTAIAAALAGAFDAVADFWSDLDDALLSHFSSLRTRAITPMMEALNSLGSEWTTRVLRWGMLSVLVAYTRWRHLVVGLEPS